MSVLFAAASGPISKDLGCLPIKTSHITALIETNEHRNMLGIKLEQAKSNTFFAMDLNLNEKLQNLGSQ